MNALKIKYNTLVKAIRISFLEDDDIYLYYDKDANVKNIDDIVYNVSFKIREYVKSVYMGVFNDGELIGYFVYQESMLISFALSIKYRQKKYLDSFFDLIKKQLPTIFVCHLFLNNSRAIKWLINNGLIVENINKNIIKLLCQ